MAICAIYPRAASASGGDVFLSVGGSGTVCSASAPCGTLQDALNAAPDGGTVIAAAGVYGDQRVIRLTSAQSPTTVTVTSATGRGADFGRVDLDRGGVTFDKVSFHAVVRVTRGPVTFNDIHMDGGNRGGDAGGGIIVRTDHVSVTNSLIEGGFGHDGINIAGHQVTDTLVRGNTIRDIGGSTDQYPAHPDCIQIFDTRNAVVEQNNLYDCYNSAVTFSPGANQGISNILLRANFIQGCIATRQRCPNGGSSIDLRQNVTNVTLTQNTIGQGSARIPYQPGVTATRNIITYLSVSRPCTTAVTDSLIATYPTWACRAVPGRSLGVTSGNQVRMVGFIGPPSGDLHVVYGVLARVRGLVAASTAALLGYDIDGARFTATTVGADEPGRTALNRRVPAVSPAPSTSTSPTRSATPRVTPTTPSAARTSVPKAIPAGRVSSAPRYAAGLGLALVIALGVSLVVLRRRPRAHR